MMGSDLIRINNIINGIKDTTAKQISLLSMESGYRINTIDHVHTVIGESTDAEANHRREGTWKGEEFIFHKGSNPELYNEDILLTGRNDPPPTNYNYPDPGHTAPSHFFHVSDQLTYPVEERGYLGDRHDHHPHMEAEMVYEREHPLSASNYATPIIELGVELGKDIEKIRVIQEKMYTDVNSFNTEYGSPWVEIYDLKDKIEQVKKYSNRFPELQWIGEKHSLLNLLQLVYTASVDTKWAMIYYHDWIQRGYDHLFNNDNPSIVWDDFTQGSTIGNRDHTYTENVRIKHPSPDPF